MDIVKRTAREKLFNEDGEHRYFFRSSMFVGNDELTVSFMRSLVTLTSFSVISSDPSDVAGYSQISHFRKFVLNGDKSKIVSVTKDGFSMLSDYDVEDGNYDFDTADKRYHEGTMEDIAKLVKVSKNCILNKPSILFDNLVKAHKNL